MPAYASALVACALRSSAGIQTDVYEKIVSEKLQKMQHSNTVKIGRMNMKWMRNWVTRCTKLFPWEAGARHSTDGFPPLGSHLWVCNSMEMRWKEEKWIAHVRNGQKLKLFLQTLVQCFFPVRVSTLSVNLAPLAAQFLSIESEFIWCFCWFLSVRILSFLESVHFQTTHRQYPISKLVVPVFATSSYEKDFYDFRWWMCSMESSSCSRTWICEKEQQWTWAFVSLSRDSRVSGLRNGSFCGH